MQTSQIYNSDSPDLLDLIGSPIDDKEATKESAARRTYDYLCNSHMCCAAKNKSVDINIVKIANTKLLFNDTCECGSVMFTRIYNPNLKSKANNKYKHRAAQENYSSTKQTEQQGSQT